MLINQTYFNKTLRRETEKKQFNILLLKIYVKKMNNKAYNS